MEDKVRDFYEENFQDSDEVTEWLVGGEVMMKDALNNDIVLGQTYGYSQRSNGVVMVTIGEAVKFNEGSSVTLKVLYKGKTLYNNHLKNTDIPKSGKVSVISNTLFKLSDTDLLSFSGFEEEE